MARVAGPAERTLIAAGIAASTFGFLDLVILVSPRVYQAMARDGLFFAAFARLHPRYRTPVAATVAQGAWACALLLGGGAWLWKQPFAIIAREGWRLSRLPAPHAIAVPVQGIGCLLYTSPSPRDS